MLFDFGSRREGTARDDLLDGGAGRDTASWGSRRVLVVVDLERQRAAARYDSDRLVSIEDAAGGKRSDRLAGDEGPNHLQGGRGADRLTGRRGNDRLDVSARVPGYDPGSDAAPSAVVVVVRTDGPHDALPYRVRL